MERPKMELEVNKPTKIKLLFNDCVEGSSKFGKYFLYAVQNGDGSSEYSLFAPDPLHEQLKKFNKGDELLVTKLASQRNNKLVVSYEVVKNNSSNTESADDNYLSAMQKSFEEAIQIQNKFNGMANVNQIAITLFIQRTRGNHQFN